MVHTVTMNPPGLSAIRLQEKGGPLDTDNTLVLGAGPVSVKAGPRDFNNQAYWDGPSTLVIKRCAFYFHSCPICFNLLAAACIAKTTSRSSTGALWRMVGTRCGW